MANSNKPFGLRPVKTLNGASANFQVQTFHVPATDSTAIFIGDMVKLAGGDAALYAGDPEIPTVTKAASTNVVVGVVVGIEPLYGSLGTNYRAASTAMNVLVCTDPQAVYEVQGDSDTWSDGDSGQNANITVSTGSTTTGISNAVVDQSTAATTATLDVQILRPSPNPENDLTGGYPLLLVKLNNHQFVDGATGI